MEKTKKNSSNLEKDSSARTPVFSISELAQKLEGKSKSELFDISIDAAKKSGSSLLKTILRFIKNYIPMGVIK